MKLREWMRLLRYNLIYSLGGVPAEVVAAHERAMALRIVDLNGIIQGQRERLAQVVPMGVVAEACSPAKVGTIMGMAGGAVAAAIPMKPCTNCPRCFRPMEYKLVGRTWVSSHVCPDRNWEPGSDL